MNKVALFILTSLPLFSGFFPQTMTTTIEKVKGDNIVLSKQFPIDGMSGIIVHKYGNDTEAITSRIMQNGRYAKLLKDESIHHDQLADIKTNIYTQDEVIGGYLYNNVLILAPDIDTYNQITTSHDKNWIHPDLFALYLAEVGDSKVTHENLKTFAINYQVGLVYVVQKNRAILIDPITSTVVKSKSISNTPAKGKYPFYMRFDEINTGWFGRSASGEYYINMGKL